MMKHLLLLLFAITACWAEEKSKLEKEEGIFILNEKNYNDAVKEHKYLMVYFYAPWCGHCKALTPVYVEAGQKLKEEDSEIRLAKVDGTENKELLEKMHVEGYPTLFFYRDGGEPIKYTGGRFAVDMINWMKKKTGPWAEPLKTADDVKQFLEDNEVGVVGFFKDQESKKAKNYLAAVRDYEEYPCAITSDEDAMKAHHAEDGQVVLFKKFDDGRAVYEGDIDKPAMLEFIQRYALPLVVDFNHDTAQKIFKGLIKSHLLLFVSKKADYYEDVVKTATDLAGSDAFRQKVMFVTVDTDVEDHRRIIEYLGLKDEKMPTMRIVQMKDDIEKYKPVDGKHDASSFEKENIRKFVQDYMDGKVPQHYRSEALPEDWNKHPVKYVTAENFEKVVMDKSKNVLIEFYAPWCGHCKQLAPVWDQLAEAMGKKDDVVVAKMDATQNELKHTKIRSFPTIKLYKKDTNDVVEYNGERTLEGLTKFLETDGDYGQAAPDHDEL